MRISQLDALRGIAAFFVVLFHFTMNREQADLGFKLGVTGVDLFFIISGFVIFMSINKISRGRDFIINRISRLYPTYWACVTITFISILFNVGFPTITDGIKQYTANMTMFQYYFRIPNLDGPYWTLMIEMLFYMFILVLFKLNLLRHIEQIGLGLLCFIIVYDTVLQDKLPYFYMLLSLGCPLLNHFPLFFAGILFFKMFTERNSSYTTYLSLLLCLLVQIGLYDNGGRSNIFIGQTQYTVMLFIYFIVFLLFVKNRLNFIISKPTLYLGKISYALYLIHQFIGVNIIIPFLMDNLNLNYWLAMFVALLIVISMASLVTFCVEIPLSKKLKENLRNISFNKLLVKEQI